MKTILRAFIIFAIIALGAYTYASESTIKEISCVSSGNAVRLFHINAAAKPVLLKDINDVCEAGFEFHSDADQTLTGIVVTVPSELGLRAKNSLYRVSFKEGTALLIGELPVSSERIGAGVYLDVFQEGGSIFLDRYNVTSDLVRLAPASLELVLDGRLCVQRKDDVWNMDTSIKKSCSQIILASFKSPVCLAHKIGKAKLLPRLACKEIEDRRPIRY